MTTKAYDRRRSYQPDGHAIREAPEASVPPAIRNPDTATQANEQQRRWQRYWRTVPVGRAAAAPTPPAEPRLNSASTSGVMSMLF